MFCLFNVYLSIIIIINDDSSQEGEREREKSEKS